MELSGFRVPTPILMRRSKSQQRHDKQKTNPLIKKLAQGIVASSAGEHPAVLPNKRVEALRNEIVAPKKPPTLRDFFMRVTARDLLQIDGKHFEYVCEDSNVAETIEVLTKNKLNAIPVKNAAGKFVGVFCVYDLIDRLFQDGAGIQLKDMAVTEPYRCTLYFQTKFAEQTMKDMPLNPWVTVGKQATLLDCLTKFGSHSTHLIGVTGEGSQDVIGILHRVQILKFLEYNKAMAKDIMNCKIKSFSHLQQSIHLSDNHRTVKAESLQDLFQSMWQKVIDGDMVSYGHTSVDKFINLIIQILTISGDLPEPDYDTVKETDTMERVFSLIIKYNTANTKLVVLDSKMQPVGTLCFCAVLNELFHMASGFVLPTQ